MITTLPVSNPPASCNCKRKKGGATLARFARAVEGQRPTAVLVAPTGAGEGGAMAARSAPQPHEAAVQTQVAGGALPAHPAQKVRARSARVVVVGRSPQARLILRPCACAGRCVPRWAFAGRRCA